MTIGDKIKALRTERGMSQDAVASALSVTRQAVAKWESNQSVPSTTNTIKLAELFQVQFQDLLSQEEIPSAEIQRYIVKVAQAEEKKKEKHISCGTEYSQHSNALAHPNPSANSNKFKLLPYHCYAKGYGTFLFFIHSASHAKKRNKSGIKAE